MHPARAAEWSFAVVFVSLPAQAAHVWIGEKLALTPRNPASPADRVLPDVRNSLLAVAPVGEMDPTDEVQLPQLHRGFPLPPLVLARVPLFLRTNLTLTVKAV